MPVPSSLWLPQACCPLPSLPERSLGLVSGRAGPNPSPSPHGHHLPPWTVCPLVALGELSTLEGPVGFSLCHSAAESQGPTHPSQGPEGSMVGQGTGAPGHPTALSPIHQPACLHARTHLHTCPRMHCGFSGCLAQGSLPTSTSRGPQQRAVRLSLPPQTALTARLLPLMSPGTPVVPLLT